MRSIDILWQWLIRYSQLLCTLRIVIVKWPHFTLILKTRRSVVDFSLTGKTYA